MKLSQNCLDLIKKWEGLFLKAYIDPVGVMTIGYGTIRYTNGQPVKANDTISREQAEALLHYECSDISESLDLLLSVPVNQNQFDALVSFCYNLGIGAFTNSTLRKKINDGDFDGAAKEFDKWVFGYVDGVKTQLLGLVNRRNDEQALFLKAGAEGKPLIIKKSIKESVTWLEAYRDGEHNVIVAWNNDAPVEILSLESRSKNDLNSLLQQYKNANDLVVAPAGKALPVGERISVAGKAKAISSTRSASAPTLTRSLLLIGMSDDDLAANGGQDIAHMQQRLNDLDYKNGKVDGIFGKNTDNAVRSFQTEYFGVSQADGKVGSKTWAKLWGDTLSPSPQPGPGKNPYLKLTKTNGQYSFGCKILRLEYFKDGKSQGHLDACSGLPTHQFFNTGSDSNAGSLEPLPEGKWSIGNIIFIDGKDVYDGDIEPGVGPVKIPLEYERPNTTSRTEILFHVDVNRSSYPGTAGCVGLDNNNDMKTLVGWLRDTNPRGLYVDWGLGTCPNPN